MTLPPQVMSSFAPFATRKNRQLRLGCMIGAMAVMGCTSLSLPPLNEDQVLAVGRLRIIENGKDQHLTYQPRICFHTAPNSRSCNVVQADGYFYGVLPAIASGISIEARSRYSDFTAERYRYFLLPRLRLSSLKSGETYYLGDLVIATEISGKKGEMFSGPKICRIARVEIQDEFDAANKAFHEKYPRSQEARLSKSLATQTPLRPTVFYMDLGTGLYRNPPGDLTFLLLPWLLSYDVARTLDFNKQWAASDSQCLGVRPWGRPDFSEEPSSGPP